jgi:hypothetical protein
MRPGSEDVGSAMNARRLAAAVVIAACACKGGESRPEGAAPSPGAERGASEAETSSAVERPGPPELPALCLLAGADEGQRDMAFTNITFAYYTRTDDCLTPVLSSAMSSDQVGEWLYYLLNYSQALFGCGLSFEPLPGGVGAFGLANTDAVGIPSPMLGADDAALLIDVYLNSCTNELPVPNTELAQLRGRLEAAAQPRIDPSLAARFSGCR